MIRAEKIDFVTKIFEMDKHSSNLPAVPNPNLPKVSSEKSSEADGEVSAMKYMKNIEAKLHKLDFYSSNFVGKKNDFIYLYFHYTY